LFCLVAIPFIARGVVAAPLLQRARARSLESYARLAVGALTVGFALVEVRQLVTNRFYVDQYAINNFGARVDEHYVPGPAADFFAATGFRGPFFCNESCGSYLIARGYKVFLDPRGDVYPNDFLRQYFTIATQPTPQLVGAVVQRYRLQAFFVDALNTKL